MAVQVPGSAHRPVLSPAGERQVATRVVPALGLALKALVVLMMVRAVADPAWANLEGKAPVARAVVFPLLVLAVPAVWAATGRVTAYPWAADILITLTCLADIVGNRLDLYDEVDWFDDAMHLVNTTVVSVVFVLLTVARPASRSVITNAAIAAGVTASLAWELFEYASFLTRTTEWTTAYSDTVGDLTLGWLGAVLAAVVVTAAWHQPSRRPPRPERPVGHTRRANGGQGRHGDDARPDEGAPATGRLPASSAASPDRTCDQGARPSNAPA